MEMDISQYKELFIAEAREHLEALNRALLDFEKDPLNEDRLTEIFRSAHTLKGMSATMGYEGMTELAHEMENVLEGLRAEEVQPTPAVVDALFRCFDTLGEMVRNIDERNTEGVDTAAALGEVRAVVEPERPAGRPPVPEEPVQPTPARPETPGPPEPPEIPAPAAGAGAPPGLDLSGLLAVQPGMRAYRVDIKLDPQCMLKSVRVFMVFKKLGQLGEIVQSQPSAEDLEDEKFEDRFQILVLSRKEAPELKSALMAISEIEAVVVDEVSPEEPEAATAPTITGPSETERKEGPVTLALPIKTQSVRVNIARLDKLMSLVGELVINRTRLQEISDRLQAKDLKETLLSIARLISDLQDEVMKTRMVPVEQIFNRFPRMVRDLARNKGKEVDFSVEGREIELDRTILDEISDPLMHLLRNAVDHGVEDPAMRQMSGKPPRCQISLRARRDRDQVSIEVSDDGPGIDIARVFALAVEKGLLGSEEARNPGPDVLLKILAHPGFSSKEEVSGVSGRGVGLDAVKSKVESLGGSLQLWTEERVGTTFAMKLPLTLAIIEALLVASAGEVYALPMGTVRETVTVDPFSVRLVRGREVILVREETIPLLRLTAMLGLSGNGSSEAFPVVICEISQRSVGIAVEELLGRQEIVITPLGPFLKEVKGFSGATILGNGQVALILDVPSFLY